MNAGTIFWMLMILWLLCLVGAFLHWSQYLVIGGSVLEWVLFALLGWKIYGPIIRQ